MSDKKDRRIVYPESVTLWKNKDGTHFLSTGDAEDVCYYDKEKEERLEGMVISLEHRDGITGWWDYKLKRFWTTKELKEYIETMEWNTKEVVEYWNRILSVHGVD
jgi:hypothetical protein